MWMPAAPWRPDGCPAVTDWCRRRVDIDDADGFERRQGFGGGEIEARGLELLFDGAVDQERERGDVDVRLHAVVGLVIDWPHVENILEVGEGALDFRCSL